MLDVLLSNPYFSAGAGLIGLGAFGAVFKQGCIRYAYFVKKQFLVSMEISSKDKSYYWVLHWLATRTQSSSNHMSVQTLFKLHDNGSSSTYFNLIPSPGIHYIKWQNRWLKVERQREKGAMDITSGNPFETVTLTTISRDPSLFLNILNEAKEIALTKQQGKTVIYTSWANEWRPFGQPHQKRPLSSVILGDAIAESIVKDVQEFNANGKWYYDRGIPYRRGYLLHGPPGTGKSSFIKALAGEFDYNICVINLNESVMTDDRLNYLLSVIPERSFLLLEDIDALFLKDRNMSVNNQSRVTFSGLLNALDGVGSSEERIVFMTTNHFERLDPALIRPGRIDVLHYIGNASKAQLFQMFLQFYPNEHQLAKHFQRVCQRTLLVRQEVQGHFILYKNDPQQAFNQLHQLSKK